jgi:hypothetical protein
VDHRFAEFGIVAFPFSQGCRQWMPLPAAAPKRKWAPTGAGFRLFPPSSPFQLSPSRRVLFFAIFAKDGTSVHRQRVAEGIPEISGKASGCTLLSPGRKRGCRLSNKLK